MAAGTWFVENSRGRFCARMADHRSLLGKREGMKSRRECQYTRELDLETLVWTRGPNFPLSPLDGRLMCPRCRSRRVVVLFQPPTASKSATPWGARNRTEMRAVAFAPMGDLVPFLVDGGPGFRSPELSGAVPPRLNPAPFHQWAASRN